MEEPNGLSFRADFFTSSVSREGIAPVHPSCLTYQIALNTINKVGASFFKNLVQENDSGETEEV